MGFRPGDIVSYRDIINLEKVHLQRGMNFRLGGHRTIILLSQREGAKYEDEVQDNGRVLIYEGHDVPRRARGPDPKAVDQPRAYPGGSLTENGKFYSAAMDAKSGRAPAERVIVYEKLKKGLWVYLGIFNLVDAWLADVDIDTGTRRVFKFRLEIADDQVSGPGAIKVALDQSRKIPSHVMQEVFKRDHGRCRQCGANDNLHFDHILPWSKGGTSLMAENIQLLCARHNLQKGARLE
ncbi:MAG: hypothetical protein RIQ81_155 [Pseudomonadota bacterium]